MIHHDKNSRLNMNTEGAITWMGVNGFQSYNTRIVENKSFIKYIHVLSPKYRLPNRAL